MAKKPKIATTKVDPRDIKSRDLLMVRVINGVTKAATHVDRRKRANKYKARKPVREGDE
jgi:hypothetical protein